MLMADELKLLDAVLDALAEEAAVCYGLLANFRHPIADVAPDEPILVQARE